MKLSKSDFGSFCLGFANFIYFKSIGHVIFLEIIAVLFLVIKLLFVERIASSLKIENRTFLRKYFFFGFIWLISQYFSDSINHADPKDTWKLLAQIVVLLVLVYWSQNWFQLEKSRITWFVFGYCLSAIPSYFFAPSTYVLIEPWKFCFGPSFTILTFLWFSRSQLRLTMQILVMLPLTFFDILVGSRSLALVTIISWSSCFIFQRNALKKTRIVIPLLATVLVAILASNIYQNLALSGHLGTNQQTKAVQQFGSGPLILVARSELLYELSAIRANLLFGTGSNPNISTDITNQVDSFNSRLGVDSRNTAGYLTRMSTGKIPQHSLLFSFWMFGGIPAAIFWLYLFFVLTKWTIKMKFETSTYYFLSRFLYVGFVWNFFFSPLGAGQRVLLVLTVGVIYYDFSKSLGGENLTRKT